MIRKAPVEFKPQLLCTQSSTFDCRGSQIEWNIQGQARDLDRLLPLKLVLKWLDLVRDFTLNAVSLQPYEKESMARAFNHVIDDITFSLFVRLSFTSTSTTRHDRHTNRPSRRAPPPDLGITGELAIRRI